MKQSGKSEHWIVDNTKTQGARSDLYLVYTFINGGFVRYTY